MLDPLIVTLQLCAEAERYFENLRQLHYPADRNQVPAHVSLFHHLPGAELSAIHAFLEALCRRTPRFELHAASLRFTGNGVAVGIVGKTLARFRAELAAEWAHWLTPQDRQGYRPHMTIQNKVSKEHARSTFEQLERTFAPFAFTAEGVDVWRYRNGPWEPVGTFSLGTI